MKRFTKQEKRSIREAMPFLIVLVLLATICLYSWGYYNTNDTVNSRVAYGVEEGNCTIYQYRIASATYAWWSDIIPLNGAKAVSLTIFEATGSTTADWTGTIGTGDLYLKGKIGSDIINWPTPEIAGSTLAATAAMIRLPYVYGDMAPLAGGQYIRGSTAIDVYGRTFYNLTDMGGLTHIQANITTNNVDNTVIISVDR